MHNRSGRFFFVQGRMINKRVVNMSGVKKDQGGVEEEREEDRGMCFGQDKLVWFSHGATAERRSKGEEARVKQGRTSE